MSKIVEYCGLDCGCYIPGSGVGTRRCRLDHWNEKLAHKLPRLGKDLSVERPFECKRTNKEQKKKMKSCEKCRHYSISWFAHKAFVWYCSAKGLCGFDKAEYTPRPWWMFW